VWTTDQTELKSSAKVYGTTAAGSIYMADSSKLLDDAWSVGKTTMTGSAEIFGHLTTGSLDMGGSAKVGGSTVGSMSSAPQLLAPLAPVVSDWVRVGQFENEWSSFNKTSITPENNNGKCDIGEVRTALTGVTQPTVIDALACKMGLTLDGNLQLPNNLVILAKGFELQGILSAAGSTDLKLWLVTPGDFDTAGIGNGTCNGNADGKLAHSSIGPIVWNSYVSAMLYTPCKITVGVGASWRGQLYGGSVDTMKDSVLEYVYVGLPGDGNFNSGDGGASGSGAGGAKTGLGKQVSVRDRNTE
jgi:hypothetical protein